MIQTVTGWIKQEEITFCHSHEHLFIAEGIPYSINSALKIDDYSLTIKELNHFKKMGGSTIADAQPLGCGRMERQLVRASDDTEVNIIAATGFHKLSFYDKNHWIWRYDVDQLTEIFIHELENGMYIDTDANEPKNYINNKAGFIKTAIDIDRLKDKEKKWFTAAARTSNITGFPIMCHTETKEEALYLAKFYIDHGVKPEKIIICHLDRTLDQLEVHDQLASMGCFLEYDTIGRFKYHSDEEEVELLQYMIQAGHSNKILLGLDTTRERLKSYGADIGLDYIKTIFIPLLKKNHFSTEVLHQLMKYNPRIAFSNLKRGVNDEITK